MREIDYRGDPSAQQRCSGSILGGRETSLGAVMRAEQQHPLLVTLFPGLRSQTYMPHEILEARVRAEAIVLRVRFQADHVPLARLVRFREPHESLLFIVHACINKRPAES